MQLRGLMEIIPVFATIYPLWPVIRNMEQVDPIASYRSERSDPIKDGFTKLVETKDNKGVLDRGKKLVYTDPILKETLMDNWNLEVKAHINGTNLFEIIRGQIEESLLGKLAHDAEYQKLLMSQCHNVLSNYSSY
jgi:hypothetical protein